MLEIHGNRWRVVVASGPLPRSSLSHLLFSFSPSLSAPFLLPFSLCWPAILPRPIPSLPDRILSVFSPFLSGCVATLSLVLVVVLLPPLDLVVDPRSSSAWRSHLLSDYACPVFPSVSLPWSLLGHCRIMDVRLAGVQLQLGVSGVQTLGMCPPSNIDESFLPFLQLREGSGWLRAWLAYSTRSRRVRGVVPCFSCFNLHIRDSIH